MSQKSKQDILDEFNQKIIDLITEYIKDNNEIGLKDIIGELSKVKAFVNSIYTISIMSEINEQKVKDLDLYK